MKRLCRWVQLSDIHFRVKGTPFNEKALRDALPGYLEKSIKEADVMFLTGDYRYGPDGEENPKKVVDFIQTCASRLSIRLNHLFIAPGNHDLSRGEVRGAIVDKIVKEYKPEDGVIKLDFLTHLTNDFTFYRSLCEQLNGSSFVEGNTPHAIFDAGEFNVLVLNTALLACGKADCRKLLIGSSLVEACVSKVENSKPIIAIGHHGLDWLREDEERTCTKFLDNKDIKLYLCGHTHQQWFSSFGECGKQVNVGCFEQNNHEVYAGFSVGELYDDGHVDIISHKWDMYQQEWVEDNANRRPHITILPLNNSTDQPEEKSPVEKKSYPFSIEGYHLLGGLGVDGIKYYWKKDNEIVESLAFNKSSKVPSGMIEDTKTSAYTISTSIGCQFAVNQEQCLFCGTGMRPFYANLRADEIALQSIFMAEYDSDCTSYPHLKSNAREFAFMGQGEPGLNYTAIREAILLTDYAMDRIGQSVSRYLICTSGTDFLPALIDDLKRKVFAHPVTIHFSLNAIDPERNVLMPMNQSYDYRDFLEQCKIYYEITKIKVSVGLLLFWSHSFEGKKEEYTLSKEKLNKILDALDSDVFKIDLCTVNNAGKAGSIKRKKAMSQETANGLLEIVKQKGFEGKIFYSFGDSENAGCGMLNSENDDMESPGSKTVEHFNRAVDLLMEAKKNRNRMLLEQE